jgi:hypothetical protein
VSVIDHLRVAPLDVDFDVEPRSRGFALWSIVPAGVLALALVAIRADLGHAAMAAALVMAIVGLTAVRLESHLAAWRHLRLALVGAGAGALGGLGGVLAGKGSTSLTIVAQLALGWTAFALVATTASGSLHPDVGGRQLHAIRASASAVGALVVVTAALVSGIEHRGAAGSAIALPVGLVLYSLVRSWQRDHPDFVGGAVTAVGAGVAAAILALMTMGAKPSAPALAVLLLGTVAVLAIAYQIRSGHPVPKYVLGAAGIVALVAAGAAPAPLALVGFAAAIALESERRPFVKTAPVRDASSRTAARVVGGLCVMAAALRTWAPRGLWLDEATGVHQARLPLVDMIRQIYRQDNHPPLSHIVLWVDIRFVGSSEFAVRLPSLVLGVLLIPMLYLTAKEFFDRRVGIIAAAIGTVAPLAVWYGQEARMYSQFMLLAVIAVWAQIRIMRTGRRGHWVIFTLSSVALIYTQYFAVLHVAAMLLVFAIEMIRRHRASRNAGPLLKQLALSVSAQIVLLAPLVPYALHQAIHNQQSGFGFSAGNVAVGSAVVPPPGIYGLLTNIQWAIFGYLPDQLTTRLVALWPIGLLLLLLMLGRPRRHGNRSLLIIAGLPVLVIFGASFIAAKSRSLAEVRYFAGAVPVVFILLAAGVTTVVASRRVQTAVVGVVLSTMLVALVIQETSASNPRLYQYREAVERVRLESGPNDRVIYAPFYLNYVLEYYNPGIPTTAITLDPAERPGIIHRDGVADALAANAPHVFVLEGASFAESGAANADVTRAIHDLEAHGMSVKDQYRYAQMTVWELG